MMTSLVQATEAKPRADDAILFAASLLEGDACAVLGIAEGSTASEIHGAYLRSMGDPAPGTDPGKLRGAYDFLTELTRQRYCLAMKAGRRSEEANKGGIVVLLTEFLFDGDSDEPAFLILTRLAME